MGITHGYTCLQSYLYCTNSKRTVPFLLSLPIIGGVVPAVSAVQWHDERMCNAKIGCKGNNSYGTRQRIMVPVYC